jgi:twitching motility protein PilT
MKQRRIDRFLRLMNDRGASDLHLTVGRPPMLRISGLVHNVRYRTIHEGDYAELIEPIAPIEAWVDFQTTGDADFAYALDDVARFRVNIFRQQRGSGAVFRVIPSRIMTLDELGLPPQLHCVAEIRSGLVLVTGPTGSGKSTTLAAIIDQVNQTQSYHIITIEEPIEFVHPNKGCIIHQREVGPHTNSFADALRVAGREDPDLILVGEMRDPETIALALEAAEKGTIVFGTLHTNSAVRTVDRIVNSFPAEEQGSIRGVLGDSLRAVIAQQLLPRKDGGRVAAIEFFLGSPATANIIREGRTAQLTSVIQTGSRHGMVGMDQSIRALYDAGLVDAQAAYDKAIDKERFSDLCGTPPAAADAA